MLLSKQGTKKICDLQRLQSLILHHVRSSLKQETKIEIIALLSLGQADAAMIFFICKFLKYKQHQHRTVRTQMSFIILQGRYHGVQGVITTPQALKFRTRKYKKFKYTTTINIQTLSS